MEAKIANEIEKINDGVYFIADETCEKTDVRNYVKLTPDVQVAPPNTKYIGVKMGDRAIAVALEDLPSDEDGELQLIPRNHTSPETSDRYSYDTTTDTYRFNVYEDFNGKANTEHLKQNGCAIDLPEETWIPSVGELGLLMMNATAINKALELAGGKPIKGWLWSSTEHSQHCAWYVGFSNGFTSIYCKYGSGAVRAVAAF